ncbi:AAA family ATPase [Deinococcus cellulosilyticus]|uniref:ORC1/DEAH AAA+ ATPase domain-containing protein n=1 Tax=Deinococcus cellulosilyticus (strain DSM 18568 / NBRC 106333 / KACC 11606 / 5516J-15) TaxID=1223518 RepID=A0A511MWN4_DEIC1|nr:AAA family ATPase [Deinococcus cellulosilyticus]GEM44970.1 hypothetical protein DC3_06050 [Deinococcus cellulosilyticus NBRC 106333 = KACC 11606]
MSQIPRTYPNEIKRIHLLQRLRQTSPQAIVALMAPSGYGKTTLLAQFARSTRRKVIWLTLHTDHSNPQYLARALIAEAQQVLSSLKLVAESTDAPAEDLGKDLAQGLNSSGQKVYVVLDRTELLSRGTGLWLQRFHAQLKDQVQLLLAGYESSPLPLAQWASRGDALILGPRDLTFTLEEMLQCTGWTAETRDLHLLKEKMEGWPAGVALVASGAPLGLSARELVDERLEQLPEDLIAALSRLAPLDVWSEQDIRALHVELPHNWIRSLMESGLPVTPLGDGKYRPHTLLREALESRLFHTGSYREVFQQAGLYHLQVHQELAALECFIKSQDASRAMELARKHISAAITRGDREWVLDLCERLSTLPGGLTEEVLLQKISMLLDFGRIAEVDALLEQHPDFEKKDVYYSTMAYYHYRRGEFQQQLNFATEGLESHPSNTFKIGLLTYRSIALGALGHHEEEQAVARELVQFCVNLQNPLAEAKAYVILASCHQTSLDRQECEQAYLRALYLYNKHRVTARLNELYYNLAYTYVDWGENQKALDLIEKATTEQNENFHNWRALFIALRCNIFVLQHQQLDQVVHDLSLAVPELENKGWTGQAVNYSLLLSEAHLMQGNLEQAKLWLLNSTNKTHATHQPADPLKLYQVMFDLHEKRSIAETTLLDDIDETQLEVYHLHRLGLLRLEQARQKGTLNRTQVEEVIQALDDLGHDGPLQAERHLLQDLYQTCIQLNWHAERFQRALNLSVAVADPVDQRPVLKISALGKLEVQVSGQRVHLPLSKAEELLLYLAVHGPNHRDRIIDALWEGSARRENVDYFKVVVRKLRSALQEALKVPFDPLPFQNRQYQISEQLKVVLDLDAIKDLQQNPVQSFQDLEQLTTLQRAEIAPHLTGEWVEVLRQDLQQQLVQVIALHIQTLAHQPEGVEKLYRFVLQIPGLDPEHYRLLEEALVKNGHTHLALQLSQESSRLLRRQLLN